MPSIYDESIKGGFSKMDLEGLDLGWDGGKLEPSFGCEMFIMHPSGPPNVL